MSIRSRIPFRSSSNDHVTIDYDIADDWGNTAHSHEGPVDWQAGTIDSDADPETHLSHGSAFSPRKLGLTAEDATRIFSRKFHAVKSAYCERYNGSRLIVETPVTAGSSISPVEGRIARWVDRDYCWLDHAVVITDDENTFIPLGDNAFTYATRFVFRFNGTDTPLMMRTATEGGDGDRLPKHIVRELVAARVNNFAGGSNPFDDIEVDEGNLSYALSSDVSASLIPDPIHDLVRDGLLSPVDREVKTVVEDGDVTGWEADLSFTFETRPLFDAE